MKVLTSKVGDGSNFVTPIESHTTSLSTDQKDLQKLFMMLIDAYSDEFIWAQELLSNGLDSKRAAKSDLPVEFRSVKTNDGYEVTISDYGLGLDKNQVIKMYTLGKSNKDHSHAFIGGYGLGSKSVFKYTDSVQVRSIKDGALGEYLIKVESSVIRIYVINQEPTKLPNQTHIEILVKTHDYERMKRTLTNRCLLLRDVRYVGPELGNYNTVKAYRHNLYTVCTKIPRMCITVGDIMYPIPWDHVNSPHEVDLKSLPIALRFTIDQIKPKYTRESIDYTPSVIKLIEDRLVEVYNDLVNKAKEQSTVYTTLKDWSTTSNTYQLMFDDISMSVNSAAFTPTNTHADLPSFKNYSDFERKVKDMFKRQEINPTNYRCSVYYGYKLDWDKMYFLNDRFTAGKARRAIANGKNIIIRQDPKLIKKYVHASWISTHTEIWSVLTKELEDFNKLDPIKVKRKPKGTKVVLPIETEEIHCLNLKNTYPRGTKTSYNKLLKNYKTIVITKKENVYAPTFSFAWINNTTYIALSRTNYDKYLKLPHVETIEDFEARVARRFKYKLQKEIGKPASWLNKFLKDEYPELYVKLHKVLLYNKSCTVNTDRKLVGYDSIPGPFSDLVKSWQNLEQAVRSYSYANTVMDSDYVFSDLKNTIIKRRHNEQFYQIKKHILAAYKWLQYHDWDSTVAGSRKNLIL